MHNKIRNIAFVVIFLLAIISFINLSLAAFSDSNPSISAYNSIFSSATPSFNTSLCQQQQDFIVQVSPSGCTPAVVRSDLLSQQDVPVFCPLVATQTNPLISLNAINSVSFTGNYPPYVNTIGFYPSQAALNVPGQTQTNYPLLSNIGYVVIDLKQFQNESSMPNAVTGNLIAHLNYNAQNIFGVGNTNFYLPQMSDADWQTQYLQYGFWNSKGFLRATNIQGNSATIQIYDGNLNPTTTLNLQVGQTSNALSMSGFALCSATMQVKLLSLQNADTMAKLSVNGNIVSVVKGQTFLNNQCQVISIVSQGIIQDAQISCNTDTGRKTFDLRVSPMVTLAINGQQGNYGIGAYLYSSPDQKTAVYLGYIGTVDSKGHFGNYPLDPTLKNLAAVLVAMPIDPTQQGVNLTNDQISSIAGWMQSRSLQWTSGVNAVVNALRTSGNAVIGAANTLLRQAISGQNFAILVYNNALWGNNNPSSTVGQTTYTANGITLQSSTVSLLGFSQGQDAVLTPQTNQYYQNATSDYQTILNTYPGETYPAGSQATLGEEALCEQMSLASSLGEENTLSGLCTNFNQRYPKSTICDVTSICNNAASISSQSDANQYISINGQSYLINLNSIYDPSYDDFGADVIVKYPNGSANLFSLVKNQPIFINQSSNDFIQLTNLNNGGISGNGTATIVGNSQTVTLTENNPTSLGIYVLTLTHINLKQFAQVSVTPTINNAGSSANFSFNIPIEKAAIQLTPDEIKSKIASTTDYINKLQTIDNATGALVNTFSTACEYTGLALYVKNFINDLGGSGIARTAVMTNPNGWNNKCSTLVSQGQFSTQAQCLLNYSNQIDSDINQYNQFISAQNTEAQNLQTPYTNNNGIFGSNVNTDQYMLNAYIPKVDSALSALSSNPCSSTIPDPTSLISDTNYKNNAFSLTDARNVELDANILSSSSSSDTLKSIATGQFCSTLTNINKNTQIQQQLADLTRTTGSKAAYVIQNKDTIPLSVTPSQLQKFSDVQSNYILPTSQSLVTSTMSGSEAQVQTIPLVSYVATVKDSSNNKNYLLSYGNDGVVTGTYEIGTNNQLTYTSVNPLNIKFNLVSASTYNNVYKSNQGAPVPEVQYFETGPYQGMPAIVPFDLNSGWYAAVEQNIPLGSATSSYTAAGQAQSFYLCNVGVNGIEEGIGMGDDICQGVNLGTNQVYGQFAGLDSSQTITLVNEAESALQQAARARANDPTAQFVQINNNRIKVGAPATNSPALQCTDIMSPSDCNILFNLCDPVVCPSSRCNFGGAYPVQDVVQSGIVGSILLCLPNWKQGIVVPVCLSGIQAGLDSWISDQEAYKSCLQDQLNTGQTTGICEEMNSIYMCQFFWAQAQPLVDLAAPVALSAITGQGTTNGGGEYLYVQNALQSAKQSANYITQFYAANSANAFKLKSTQSIGSAVCQNFASLTIPGGTDIANSLSTVDSPPQFTGTFQEIPFTSATVPPTSQYEVYYHIYAGKNSGVYYSIYLQRSSSSSYYQGTSSIHQIDSGYVAAGGYQDQTKDFTATSGYNQLCINVNGQIDCNFQSVSTSAAIDILKSQYISSEVNNTQITTESDCVSGTPNIYGLANPNIQNGVTNAINPQLYNQGITRVCATANPGQGTDPNAGAQNSQWVKVGTCGSSNLYCWLNTQNVANIINSPDIAAYLSNGTTQNLGNATLQSVENNYASILSGTGFLNNDQFVSNITAIQAQTTPQDQINSIQNVLGQVFYNNQKAYLLFLRGEAYKQLALQNKAVANPVSNPGTSPASGTGLPDGSACATGTTSGTGSACASGYCDTSTYPATCKENPSGSPTTGTGSGTTTSPTFSSSGVTSDVLLNAMTYAQTNSIVNSKCNCGANCKQYANSIVDAASSIGEDPVLLLSIMMQESQCDVNALNQNSVGLMQINTQQDLKTLCGAVGVNSASDITGSDVTKYVNNINCGALILKNKYDTDNQGKTYTCGTFSVPYTGWNAAIRGYIGYGCTGDPNTDVTSYVADVDNRYTALINIINQNKGPSSTNPTTGATTSTLPLTQFNTYKSLFDKYTQDNLPAVTAPNDFEALLVAIAQENNWGGSNGYLLMGYQPSNTDFQSADSQILIVSSILQSAMNGPDSTTNLGYQLGSTNAYSSCNSLASAGFVSQISCILSVYHTGQVNSAGFLTIGANTDGINYAKAVLNIWNSWDTYFNSGTGTGVSGSAH